MKTDIVAEAARGTPAVVGAWYAWATSSTGVATVTFLYIVLQLAYLARKWWREEHETKASKQSKR